MHDRTCGVSPGDWKARRDDRALRPAVHAIYDRYLEATRRELERAGFDEDTDALARVVFAALDGLVLQLLSYARPEDADAAIAALRRLLADHLAARRT